MTDEAKALVERLQEIAQFIEAAKRHVYGLPVAAIRSDTHDNKMALWCDNGMAGVGQVCVSVNVGEFPDQQLSAIAGLTNAAMSALKCLYASADLIETQAREAAAKDAELAKWKALAETLAGALDQFDEGCAAIGGCSDGYCVIQRPKGQHTNGGCRCSDDRNRMRRFASRAAYFREKVAQALTSYKEQRDA